MSSSKKKTVSPDILDWDAINWHEKEKIVDNLQKQIYHAMSENNSKKVRNLQRMLIYSDSTLLLAIKKSYPN